MRVIRRFLPWAFLALYAFAVLILLIGMFGWFGADRDPLSSVYLVLLGLPWIWLSSFAPETMQVAVAILAPAVNACLLFWVCRMIR